jgi:fumarylacetoacetase
MSWIEIPAGSPFPLGNLPLGIGHSGDDRWRAWVAIGDMALDLAAVEQLRLFGSVGLPDGVFAQAGLNRYLASGRSVWRTVRERLTVLLSDAQYAPSLNDHLHPLTALEMGLPVRVGDYVDFYSSIHHATNLGRLFRPDGEALMPSWRRIPIGYHGRSGSLVPDGTEIVRPTGYRLVDGEPIVGPRAHWVTRSRSPRRVNTCTACAW